MQVAYMTESPAERASNACCVGAGLYLRPLVVPPTHGYYEAASRLDNLHPPAVFRQRPLARYYGIASYDSPDDLPLLDTAPLHRRSAFSCRASLLGVVEPIADIAHAGHDVASVVELLVDGADDELRALWPDLGDPGEPLLAGDDAAEDDSLDAPETLACQSPL